MGVSKKVAEMMAEYSWAARPPLSGEEAAKYIDLSSSTASIKPPEKVHRAFLEAVKSEPAGAHRYMTNAGYIETRRVVSEHLSSAYGIEVPPEYIIMSYGASGGLNVVLKSLLNPNEEVIITAPHPYEYPVFVSNHCGEVVTVGNNEDFSLNPGRIAAAVDCDTKALMLSCPNDPTGVVCSGETLRELAKLLKERQKHFKNAIYIIWDRRYARIRHDGAAAYNLLAEYDNTILVGSFSKELRIGGARAGYIAINPACTFKDQLFSAMAMIIRTLGFVNCPALSQRAIACMDHNDNGDLSACTEARDIMCAGLKKAGYEFQEPKGGCFVFVKTPKGEGGFVERLKREGLLVVPGEAFGAPGYFRVSFCVENEVIRRALKIFERVGPKR